MTAEQFVKELRECAPSREELEAFGLSPDEAAEIIRRNHAVERIARSGNQDPLIDLLDRYDLSTVEVGAVRFLGAPIEHERWLEVGKSEADPIVLNKQTAEVEVRDLREMNFVIHACAATSHRFLAALAQAACAISSMSVAESSDAIALYHAAQKCADTAGGERYVNFYEMLFGCVVE